jgi:hypothetical protein
MTDFSSYILTICSTKSNFPYHQKSQIFDVVAKGNSKSVSFKNKNLLITRSALVAALIEKLTRNSRCVKIPAFIQKQYQLITSRWNKLVIPRPLPIKFNGDIYTCCASHSSKPFIATGDYYGCIELMKMGDARSEKLLLKSKFVTITNVIFHQTLPLVFAIDSKGNSKMWQIGSKTREFWIPSREVTEIREVALHPNKPIIVIADKENTTVFILNNYGQEIGYIFLQNTNVSFMTFSKSGRHLAIGNTNGEIKLFLFDQDIDFSWNVYQMDSFEYYSQITNIVLTDKILIFSGIKEQNFHVLSINDESKLSKSQIYLVNAPYKLYIDKIKMSDCGMFFFVKSSEYKYSYDLYDSYNSDDLDDLDIEDILEQHKISVFLLNTFNEIVQIGETKTSKNYFNFGRNGELICA